MDNWEMKDHVDDLKRRVHKKSHQAVSDYDYIMDHSEKRNHKMEAYCHLLEASQVGGHLKTASEGLENIKASMQ